MAKDPGIPPVLGGEVHRRLKIQDRRVQNHSLDGTGQFRLPQEAHDHRPAHAVADQEQLSSPSLQRVAGGPFQVLPLGESVPVASIRGGLGLKIVSIGDDQTGEAQIRRHFEQGKGTEGAAGGSGPLSMHEDDPGGAGSGGQPGGETAQRRAVSDRLDPQPEGFFRVVGKGEAGERHLGAGRRVSVQKTKASSHLPLPQVQNLANLAVTLRPAQTPETLLTPAVAGPGLREDSQRQTVRFDVENFKGPRASLRPGFQDPAADPVGEVPCSGQPDGGQDG